MCQNCALLSRLQGTKKGFWPRVKLTSKADTSGSAGKLPMAINTELPMAAIDYSGGWTFLQAMRELVSSTLDEARIIAKDDFWFRHPTPPVRYQSTCRTIAPKKGGSGRGKIGAQADELVRAEKREEEDEESTVVRKIVFFVEYRKLAEIVCQTKVVPWVMFNVISGRRVEPSEVHKLPTRVITITTYGSHMAPEHFQVQQQKRRGIGNHSEGMKFALVGFVRRGANVSVQSKGYKTRIVQSGSSVYHQHELKRDIEGRSERKVVTQIVFPPREKRLERPGVYAGREFDLFTRDPASTLLRLDVDHVWLENAQALSATDRDMVILDKEKAGEVYCRGVFMCEIDNMLFGYNFSYPGGKLLQIPDGNGMDESRTLKACAAMVDLLARQSPRLRRYIVKAYENSGNYGPRYVDLRQGQFDEHFAKLVQQTNQTMNPGTVMVFDETRVVRKVALLRGVTVVSCPRFLCEGATLVKEFVKELHRLPREEIGQDGGAVGWASVVRKEMLHLTGATTMAAVDFPGKLVSKPVLWVDKEVVLVSRAGLAVEFKRQDFVAAKLLLDVITLSTQLNLNTRCGRRKGFKSLADIAFAVYHLVTNAEDTVEKAVGNVPVVPKEAGALTAGVDNGKEAPQNAKSGTSSTGLAGDNTFTSGDAVTAPIVSGGGGEAAGRVASTRGARGVENDVASEANVSAGRAVERGGQSPRSRETEEGASEAENETLTNQGTVARDTGRGRGVTPDTMEIESGAGGLGGGLPNVEAATARVGCDGGASDPKRGGCKRRRGAVEGGLRNRDSSIMVDQIAVGRAELKPGSAENEGGAKMMELELSKGAASPGAVAPGGGCGGPGDASTEVSRGGVEGDIGSQGAGDGLEAESVTADSAHDPSTCDEGSKSGKRAHLTASHGQEVVELSKKRKQHGIRKRKEDVGFAAVPVPRVPFSEQTRGVSALLVKMETPSLSPGVESVSPQLPRCAGLAREAKPAGGSAESVEPTANGERKAEGPRLTGSGEAEGTSRRTRSKRNGEELSAFISAEGQLVPALIHVEERAVGSGSADLYRIAGGSDNESRLVAKCSAVMGDAASRRVIESAVEKPGVDIGLFCCDDDGAPRAFVGQEAGRLFLNVHYHSGEWAKDDLPATLAHEMAHIRSCTSSNVHDHRWSVDFRKWVRSEDV